MSNDLQKIKHSFFDEFVEKFKNDQAFLKRSDTPPWVRRKYFEYIRSFMDPYISRDLSVLKVCSWQSVGMHRETLAEYFNEVHSLSIEMADTWIMYFVTRNPLVMNSDFQIDGLKYFDHHKKTATHGDSSQSSYEAMNSNIKYGIQHRNLHIGGSATKSDVKWFIDNTWKEYVASNVEPRAFKGRMNPEQALRRYISVRLKAQGYTPKQVRDYCDDMFDIEPIEESGYRRTFIAPAYKDDMFYETREQLGSDLGKRIKDSDPIYNLSISNSSGHFELKLAK